MTVVPSVKNISLLFGLPYKAEFLFFVGTQPLKLNNGLIKLEIKKGSASLLNQSYAVRGRDALEGRLIVDFSESDIQRIGLGSSSYKIFYEENSASTLYFRGAINVSQPSQAEEIPQTQLTAAQIAALLNRSNHTGTQPASTINGLSLIATTGSYSDLLNRPSFSEVATTGSYNSLINRPTFSEVATTGSYDSLINRPNFSAVATSGLYSSLLGLPSLGGSSSLNVGTTAGTVAPGNILDSHLSSSNPHPNLALVSRTGSYSDLVNTPVLGSASSLNAPVGANANPTQVVLGSDTRLTNAREWTAETVSKITAEQGSSTARYAWTPLRVRQATQAWWLLSPDSSKLATIQAGATANATNAQLRDRATHTGTQPASTVTGLSTVATTGLYSDLIGAPTSSTPTDWVDVTNKPAWITGSTAFGQAFIGLADATAARTNLSLGGAAVLNVGTTTGTVAAGNDSRFTDARTPLAHTHGNITNVGAIGSTANLPVITGASGVLQTGTFGSAANTFCQGNDARLSDARTPTAHNQAWSTITATPTTLTGYGITDAQPLDSDLTAIAALTTTTFGRSFLDRADATAGRTLLGLGGAAVLNVGSLVGTVAAGDDARFTDARTPLAHTHGNISNLGAIGSTANLPVITTTAGVLTTGTFGSAANSFCQGNDARLSDARTPTAHNQAWSTITATPTTLTGYGITDAQPLDADLTAIAALTTTAFGRSFLDRADATAARTLLALGSLATQSGTFSGTSSGTNTGDQTITLTGEATGSGTGSFAVTLTNSAVIGKVLTGFVSGAGTVAATDTILQAIQKLNGNAAGFLTTASAASTYQPLDSDLTSIAALSTTAFGRSFLDRADATAGRTLLGLGTLATQSGTFSGSSSGTNTGDQTITLTGEATGSGTGSFAVTLTNSAVIGKVLTGFVSGAGTVTATDSILQAIQKLNGNAATFLTSAAAASSYQPLDSDLTAIAALTTTTFGRSFLDRADAAAARTLLALGGAATLNVGTVIGTVAAGDDARLSDSRTPLAHTHGNITNVGAIGSTANLPVITTTAGILTTGTFGSTANSFCQGNDARLSDARTPVVHNQAWSTITATPTTLTGYGITDAQPLDSDLTAIAALTTTTFGRSFLTQADATAGRTLLALGGAAVLNVGTGAGQVAAGNDSRFTDTRTPTAGSVVNASVSASAAIAGTKISPDFGSQNVTTTGIISANSFRAALGSSSVPSYSFTGDTDTGLFSPGPNELNLVSGGNLGIYIKSDGKVGIGGSETAQQLHVTGNFQVRNPGVQTSVNIGAGTTVNVPAFIDIIGDTTYTDYGLRVYRRSGPDAGSEIISRGTGSFDLKTLEAADVTVSTFNTLRLRLQADGNLVYSPAGTTSVRKVGTTQALVPQLFIESSAVTTGSLPLVSLVANSNDANSATLNLGKTRGTTLGSTTVVQNDDRLGAIRFAGSDGTNLETFGTEIACTVDGTPSTGLMPTTLAFRLRTDSGAVRNSLSLNRFGAIGLSDPANLATGSLRGSVGDVLTSGGSSATAYWTGTSSTNVVSTLVARDGSGNFSAGTITAALNGNALSVTNGVYTISNQSIGGVKTFTSSPVVSVSGGPSSLEIGFGTATNQFAFLDLVTDTTYTDYGLRLVRDNTGANGESALQHRGTGSLVLRTLEAGSIVFTTTNTPRATIFADGTMQLNSGVFNSGAAVNSTLFATTTTGNITIGGGLTTGTLTLSTDTAAAVQLPSTKTRVGNTTLLGGGTVSVTLPASAGTLALTSTTLSGYGITDAVSLGGAQTITAAKTFRAANAIRSEAASTQDAIVIAGRAGGTTSLAVTLTPATLTGNRTLTLPDAAGTVALASTTLSGYGITDAVSLAGAQTITAVKTFRAAAAIRSEVATAQDAVVVAGRAGGTGSFAVTLTPTTLTANQTITLPNATGTVALTDDARFGSSATELTVASNAVTLDASQGTRRIYTINITSTAGFTFNLTNLPADPNWWQAEVIITTSAVPASFTFAGGSIKTDVFGSTLLNNPFERGKITTLILCKQSAGRFTAEFSPSQYSSNRFGTKFSDPTTLLAASNEITFNPLGTVVLAASEGAAPRIGAWGWSDSTGFGTRYADPAVVPTGNTTGVVFTPANDAVICAHGVTPFTTAWPWTDGGGFGTKYANPGTVLTTVAARSCHINPAGDAVVFTMDNTPFVAVYSWNSGTGFGSRFADPATIPAAAGRDAQFSPGGDAIVFAGSSSGINAWPWSGAGFGTAYSAPATLPSGNAGNLSFNPAGTAVAIVSGTTPFVQVYPWSSASGFGSKYPDPSSLPPNSALDVKFSVAGDAIVVGHNNSPWVSAWAWSTTTGFGERFNSPSTALPSGVRSVAFSPSGASIAMSTTNTPFTHAYQWIQ